MNRFQKFMQGRYGSDQLNIFLIVMAMIAIAAGFFLTWSPALSLVVDLASWGLIIWSIARMFSKKIDARRMENYKFCAFVYRIRNWFKGIPAFFRESGKYRRFKCPQCGQKVRVPRHLGKVNVTCPKCGTKFMRNT